MENNNAEEQITSFFDSTIDEHRLSERINLIRELLAERSSQLRFKIPSDKQDNEMLADENFRKWNIVNLILSASYKDEDNISFNRLIYYMYEQLGDIDSFISQYDIKATEVDGTITNFDLVIVEN